MRTFALLPLNKPIEAKSRLAGVLRPEERRGLVLAMARDVLESLGGLETVLVCREDVRKELRDYDYHFLLQRNQGLGNAVEAGNFFALQQGAEATFFLPADVPLVRDQTIREVLALGEEHRCILSPGRRRGLGLLYRRPPDLMQALFTDKSYDDNLHKAASMDVDTFIYSSPELYADIDTPSDLKEFLTIGKGTRSYDYLRALGNIL